MPFPTSAGDIFTRTLGAASVFFSVLASALKDSQGGTLVCRARTGHMREIFLGQNAPDQHQTKQLPCKMMSG